uniref:Uncharacterized protein n=1 Tax=Romanomermis culicivorax TaxID=13658 RepID=A0A915K3P3_ROMCU
MDANMGLIRQVRTDANFVRRKFAITSSSASSYLSQSTPGPLRSFGLLTIKTEGEPNEFLGWLVPDKPMTFVVQKEKSKEKNKPEIKVNLKFDKDEFDDDDDY